MSTLDRLGLENVSVILVRQRRELGELLGFETRNKYSIEREDGAILGYAAEQQKGILGFLLRQFIGHWRRFHFTIFDSQRQSALHAEHPFRFLFQRMELFSAPQDQGGVRLGAIQQRFGVLRKKIDIEDARGEVLFRIESPIWRIWTFPVYRWSNEKADQELARISKKWGGLLKEAFLDADTFRVEFLSASLRQEHRLLILASALFVDLQYFEKKAGK